MSCLTKIFCVSKNETDLIERWIVHHASLVGLENIVVIDNRSTCPTVLGAYDTYAKGGLVVERCESYSGTSQGDAFTKAMQKHKLRCRFLIGIDTDEFIHFSDFLTSADLGLCEKKRFQNYLLGLPTDTTRFQIQTYFQSIPDPESEFYVDQRVVDPVRNISTFAEVPAKPAKCFFRSEAFVSTANGCHDGRVKRGKTASSDICLVHFNNTGARTKIEKARAIIDGYGYANVDAPLQTQLGRLLKVSSPYGSHRVTEYGIFLSKMLTLVQLKEMGLWPTSPAHLHHVALDFPSINGFRPEAKNYLSPPDDWVSEFDGMIFHDPKLVPTRPRIVHKQPRVALMLSGHFRNFAKRREFWKSFVKGNKGVDIFIHTWAEGGVRSKSSWICMGQDAPDFDEIRRTLNPVAMKVEDHSEKRADFSWQQEGLDLFYTQFSKLGSSGDFTKNVASQLYSISQAFDLAETSGNVYDVYVMLRADAIVGNFNAMLTKRLHFLRDDVLVVNGSGNHVHPGSGKGCRQCDAEFNSGERVHADHSNDVCDIFYYGNFKVMKFICGMFYDARDLVKSFKFHNARAITTQAVKASLVHHANVIGVKSASVYEHHIKCFYPERLIREYMNDFWILSDPLGATPRIVY